jgi:hypothetical protein
MPDEVKKPAAEAPAAQAPAAEAPADPSRAKVPLDEYRRRMALSHGDAWGHPGITFGPLPFAPPYEMGAPPWPFPPPPGMMPPFSGAPHVPDARGREASEPCLWQSLGTMIRLSVDLINSGLQGLASAIRPHETDCGCGCGDRECAEPCCDCCGYYSSPCGCRPSVSNCP